MFAVVRQEIKHNEGLPLLPAQRWHVRRLIWACRRFSASCPRGVVPSNPPQGVERSPPPRNSAFHVPDTRISEDVRTGWAGQQQHPGIGPFGEVPSKLIQNLVTPTRIKSFASRGFRPRFLQRNPEGIMLGQPKAGI